MSTWIRADCRLYEFARPTRNSTLGIWSTLDDHFGKILWVQLANCFDYLATLQFRSGVVSGKRATYGNWRLCFFNNPLLGLFFDGTSNKTKFLLQKLSTEIIASRGYQYFVNWSKHLNESKVLWFKEIVVFRKWVSYEKHRLSFLILFSKCELRKWSSKERNFRLRRFSGKGNGFVRTGNGGGRAFPISVASEIERWNKRETVKVTRRGQPEGGERALGGTRTRPPRNEAESFT